MDTKDGKKIFVTFEQDDHTRFTVARVEHTDSPKSGDILTTEELNRLRDEGTEVEFLTAVKLNIPGLEGDRASQPGASRIITGDRGTLDRPASAKSPPKSAAQLSEEKKVTFDLVILSVLFVAVVIYFVYTFFA